MRWIACLNFAGVVALAVLLAIQWERNSRLNLWAIELQKTRDEQQQNIAGQETSIKNLSADLDDFRGRLSLAEDELKQDEIAIAKLRHERDTTILERNSAIAERDAVKRELEPWMDAVKQRDELLAGVDEKIKLAAKERNDAIARCNELTIKYNELVKDLNDARAKLAGNH